MLIREERTLITGDACNAFTFLFDAYSTGLSTYEKNLTKLKAKTAGKFDRVYLSHGPGRDYPVVLLEEVLEVCEDIKSGNVDDVPFESRKEGTYRQGIDKGRRTPGRETRQYCV